MHDNPVRVRGVRGGARYSVRCRACAVRVGAGESSAASRMIVGMLRTVLGSILARPNLPAPRAFDIVLLPSRTPSGAAFAIIRETRAILVVFSFELCVVKATNIQSNSEVRVRDVFSVELLCFVFYVHVFSSNPTSLTCSRSFTHLLSMENPEGVHFGSWSYRMIALRHHSLYTARASG